MPGIDNKKLTLWAYNFSNSGVPTIVPYDTFEQLHFSTIAPGGYGDFTCRIKTKNARNVPTELTLMSNMALMGGDFPVFLGRWEEPGIVLDQNDGDVWEMTAQSAASVLQDDPDSVAYSLKTGYQVITGELSRRSAYLPISSDYTLILPDNPSVQLSPVFDGKNVEEVLNEIIPVLGDYTWEVWGHASARDGAGFPTWQLQAHKRDSGAGTGTINYISYTEEINNYSIRPAMEYSYNVVTLKYRDINNNNPVAVTVTDTRLAGSGAQGSAPFPRRKLVKDFSAYHLSGAQALAIANALLNQYQNGGWKITVVLDRVLNAQGQEIPLWQCRADSTILLPNISPIASQLPVGAVVNGNLFYITETTYDEADGQTPQLTITCDSFYDKASFQVARLQYREDHKIRSRKTRQTQTIPGEQATGTFTVTAPSSAVLTDIFTTDVTYGTLLTNTPTSISYTITSSSNYGGSTFTNALTNQGFRADVSPLANGSMDVRYSYKTVGA